MQEGRATGYDLRMYAIQIDARALRGEIQRGISKRTQAMQQGEDELDQEQSSGRALDRTRTSKLMPRKY